VHSISNKLLLLMPKIDDSYLGALFMRELSGMRVTTAILVAAWPGLTLSG
jgi:hypothetical protein